MPEADPLAAVRRLAQRERAARTERDEAIRSAMEAGHSLRAVGEAAGLSHSAIAKIVRR